MSRFTSTWQENAEAFDAAVAAQPPMTDDDVHEARLTLTVHDVIAPQAVRAIVTALYAEVLRLHADRARREAAAAEHTAEPAESRGGRP